jgi:MoaA/NifB/PqqE/SkfB family radical SAM enzyme
MSAFKFDKQNFSGAIFRKIDNEDKLWQCVADKQVYIPYFPPRITFITSKRCNLACRFCYHFRHKYFEHVSPLDMPVMDKRLVYKVAEELFPTLQYYETTLLGDPFLSPHLETELALAAKHDVYMRPTTNGTTLTDKNIADVSGHMDWLKCSFDSHIRGVYNSIRIGARFENTVKKLHNFVKRREGMRPFPYFRMGLVMNDLNLEEIPDYFLWCHEYMGVDDVEIMGLNVDSDHIEALSIFDKAPLVNKVLDKTIERAIDKKYKLRLDFTCMPETPDKRFVCQERSAQLRKDQAQYGFVPPANFDKMSYVIQNPRNAWEIGDVGYVWSNNMREQNICVEFMNRPFILDNGNVEACGNCNTFKVGNLKWQNFSEVWNSELYQYVRSAMYNGKIKVDWPDACNDCICMGVTYDRGRSDHRHKPFYRVVGLDSSWKRKEIRQDVGPTHGPVDFSEEFAVNDYVAFWDSCADYDRIIPDTSGVYLSDLYDDNEKGKSGWHYDKMNIFTPLNLNRKIYSKGLACPCSPQKGISFILPRPFTVFKAVLGLGRVVLNHGSLPKRMPVVDTGLFFTLLLDGREIFKKELKNGQAEPVSVPIHGGRKLTLLVSQVNTKKPCLYYALWCDAKVE